MHSIKIENIAPADYAQLQAAAEAAGLSLRNYVRSQLGLPEAKRGNPTGNKGRKINQPKGKKRKGAS